MAIRSRAMTAYFCEEFRLEDPAERESHQQLARQGPRPRDKPFSARFWAFGGTPEVGRAQEPTTTRRAL